MGDKRLLKVIRALLTAGVLENGLVGPTDEGTPQGGPLSPLLSNIVPDILGRELERRGHCFVRYVDDCNTYVRGRWAGERTMASIVHFLEVRLKLKVNRAKSAVDHPWRRKFLGFSFTNAPAPWRRIAPQAGSSGAVPRPKLSSAMVSCVGSARAYADPIRPGRYALPANCREDAAPEMLARYAAARRIPAGRSWRTVGASATGCPGMNWTHEGRMMDDLGPLPDWATLAKPEILEDCAWSGPLTPFAPSATAAGSL